MILTARRGGSDIFMGTPLRILIVDDSEDDAALLVRDLRGGGYKPISRRVDTADAMSAALHEKTWDLIISDYVMPTFSGIAALELLKERGLDIPFIIVSGAIGEETAAAAMRAGADDYIMKDNLMRLIPAVERELGEARDRLAKRSLEERLRESEEKYRGIFENSRDVIYITDEAWNFVDVNQAASELLGYTEEDFSALGVPGVFADPLQWDIFQQELKANGYIRDFEVKLRKKDGAKINCLATSTVRRTDGGRILGYQGILYNITDRKKAEEERARLSLAIEQAAESIIITDTDAKILYVNPAFEKISGYGREEVMGENPRILNSGLQDKAFYRDMWDTLNRGKVWSGHFKNKRKDGSLYEEEATISPVFDPSGWLVNYVAVKRDVTYEKEIEEQLRQAQKLEAVGRLAGGIAHDFNNILTVIMLHCEASLVRLDTDDPFFQNVEEIMNAAERAASLISQLLAFSRRRIVQPEVLNLNTVVADMHEMLRRLIGEDIELLICRSPSLGNVKVEHRQMQQVIMNLAVNARDAMPRGGKLTLDTMNVDLDDAGEVGRLAFKPGSYVMLSVSDTGEGMDEVTQARIFEPFFSTKKEGEGTGLGLSTVYGIIKQGGGDICVASAPGQGSTFKIYLPRVEEPAEVSDRKDMQISFCQGTETILLVEDEEPLRRITREILEVSGYRVLDAGDGCEALLASQRYRGSVHLLLTDVVMPHMNGIELAKRLAPFHPEMKVLYISGYPENSHIPEIVLDAGSAFLKKPFRPEVALQKIRQLLDEPRKEGE